MKRFVCSLVIILTASLCLPNNTYGQNCTKRSKREMYGMLGGYFYDASRATSFQRDSRGLTLEFEVNLFSASVYNMVFDVSAMPAGAKIKIFELGKGKTRTLAFSSDTAQVRDNKTISYKVQDGQRKKVVIVYEVPPKAPSGCITYILGFKAAEESVAANRKRYKIVD